MRSILSVAKEAGVAPSTVSRVLNGSYEVSEPTRKLVLSAAEKLGYTRRRRGRPSRHADGRQVVVTYSRQSVRGGAMTTLVRRWMAGINDHLAEIGRAPVLLACQTVVDSDYLFQQSLEAGEYCGAIMIGPQSDDGYVRAILSAGLPAVLMNRPPEHGAWSCVTVDYFGGGAQAAEHLLKLGHQRIGISGWPGWQAAAIRAGYRQSLDNASLQPVLDETSGPDVTDPAYLAAFADALIRSKATAALVCGDFAAAALAGVLSQRGVNVPRDLSLIGFDDMELTTPGRRLLSSVGYDKHLMGWNAAGILGQMIKGDAGVRSMSVVMQTELVAGETCAPVRGTGAVTPAPVAPAAATEGRLNKGRHVRLLPSRRRSVAS